MSAAQFQNTGATRSACVPMTGGDVPVSASLYRTAPGASASGGLSDAEVERDLAPVIAAALARDKAFCLRTAIADWQTTQGLDALREALVARGLFDTEALRVITDHRRRIGGGK